MSLDLDAAQMIALREVASLYLAETTYAMSASFCGPASAQTTILQRRDACEALVNGQGGA